MSIINKSILTIDVTIIRNTYIRILLLFTFISSTMTWNQIADFIVLAFVSFQGVLLLVNPEQRNRLYDTVAEGNRQHI